MKYKTIKSILAYLLFLGSLNLIGGNVTIITHGFNSKNFGYNTNSWIWKMAFTIGDYEKRTVEYGKNDDKTFYLVGFDENDSFKIKSKLVLGKSIRENPSGDIIVVLDWNPYSGDTSWIAGGTSGIRSTIPVSKLVADFLVTDGSFKEINGPITQFPIHLIGHSRGGSLVCEIGKRLGEFGIYVHHITTLDPHPLDNDGFGGIFESFVTFGITDGTAKQGILKNVIFADNYYQLNNISLPNGTEVFGAANRNVSSETKIPLRSGADEHGLVHAWYYATTHDNYPFNYGKVDLFQDERAKWFTQEEQKGKTAGYIYSFRAGQRLDNFSINGYEKDFLNNIKFGAGESGKHFRSGQPQRLFGNKAKNILALFSINSTISNMKPYSFGEPIDYTQTTRINDSNLKYNLIYQADFPNSKPYEPIPLSIFIDKYENIHFGLNRLEDTNSIVFESFTIPSTGEWNINKVTLDYSNLVALKTPGLYRVGAVIGDDIDARVFYSNERIFVEPDAKIDFKFTPQENNYAFFLYGTVDREFIFQRSFDLKNWENISTGRFMKFEDGNLSGRNIIYSNGTNPQTYWRLVYK